MAGDARPEPKAPPAEKEEAQPAEAAAASDGWRLEDEEAPPDWGEVPENDGEVVALPPAAADEKPPELPPPRQEVGFALCLLCFGSGEVSTPLHCPTCGGNREEWCEGMSLVCPTCHGTGRVNVTCERCGGDGWVKVEAPPASNDAADAGEKGDSA